MILKKHKLLDVSYVYNDLSLYEGLLFLDFTVKNFVENLSKCRD